MGNKDANHIVEVAEYHKARHQEKEPCHPHPGVNNNSRSFVILVHVLLVVNVVASHLHHQRIVGALAAQTVVTFRLICSQSLRGESVKVAIVDVVRCAALESVHITTNILSWRPSTYKYHFDTFCPKMKAILLGLPDASRIDWLC